MSQHSAELPRISVCIIVRNEEKNLARCLESLVRPQWPETPKTPWEIIVVDNDSTDRTRERFEEFSSRHPSIDVRWVGRRANHVGSARKLAIERARGSVVAFLDADCSAPQGWIDGIYESLLKERRESSKIAAVGGGNSPPEGTIFHDSLRAILSSFLGSMGSVQARSPRSAREVDHLPTCNIAYQRSIVLEAGNFSEFFPLVGEDLEMSRRLRSRGFKLIFVPGIDVVHHHAPSISGWARKVAVYGRAQPRVALLYPSHLVGVRGLPLIALLGLGLFVGFHPLCGILVLLSYLGILGVLGIRLSRTRGGKARAGWIAALYAVTHFGYAGGEVYGVFETAIDRWKISRSGDPSRSTPESC